MESGVAPNLIVWSDRYSVGIARIDAQHQRLIDLLNELQTAMQAGEGHLGLRKILDALAAYAVSHFTTEEGLMKKFGYTGYDQHKTEHERLMAQVKLLQQKSESNQLVITPEVLTFGQRWLIGHIVYLDKKYMAHLNAAGVT
jgi:hemerythrin-like metal-binding protein